jgi:hypothetical protein
MRKKKKNSFLKKIIRREILSQPLISFQLSISLSRSPKE